MIPTRRLHEQLDGDNSITVYKGMLPLGLHLEDGNMTWSLCFKAELSKVQNVDLLTRI